MYGVEKEVGAGGRTRTDTTVKGPRILSPVRLPFRHTGNSSHPHFGKSALQKQATGGQRL